MTKEIVAEKSVEKGYGKKQIMSSEKYLGKRDLLNAILEDDMEYTLKEVDAVAGSQASAYIMLADGNRYCFMQLYSFESSMEVNITEVPILGKAGKGNKPTGWSGTAHCNQSIIRDICTNIRKQVLCQHLIFKYQMRTLRRRLTVRRLY